MKEAREEALKQMISEFEFTWMYVMVRLIDIDGKVEPDDNGDITAQCIMNKLDEMHDVYTLFNTNNTSQAGNHIVVGVENRAKLDDRIDAYILVGMRVVEGTDLSYHNDVSDWFDDILCVEDMSFDITDEHYHVIEDDAKQVVWLESLINDMESVATKGDKINVMW